MTLRILSLAAVWVVLFRRVTPGVLLSGLAVAALAAWLVPGPTATRPRARAFAFLVGRQVGAIGRTTAQVARVVLARDPRRLNGLVDVELPPSTAREVAWTSSLTTLTPGTFVVDVAHGGPGRRPTLRVHALDASRPGTVALDVLETHAAVQAALAPRRADAPRPRPQEARR